MNNDCSVPFGGGPPEFFLTSGGAGAGDGSGCGCGGGGLNGGPPEFFLTSSGTGASPTCGCDDGDGGTWSTCEYGHAGPLPQPGIRATGTHGSFVVTLSACKAPF